jgi:prenylcysteine oxidase/farnesylcysteine lyase
MLLNNLVSTSSWLVPLVAAAGASASASDGQTPVKQIAVIGAGAAGSSAAFHLSRFAAADGSPLAVNVTVFERTARIGGRTLTVNAHDDPAMPLEQGASVFVEINSIIYDAVKEFGLPLNDFDGDGLMAIWDGDRFVYESDESSSWWWEAGKLLWKYGLSPIRVKNLRDSTIGAFLKMYEAPYFPFRSLTKTAIELGLEKATSVMGDELLESANVAPEFARDIVQAATRVNYASNLDGIHGLEAMVSMAAPEGAKAVQGGNWRVFATMLESCNATCSVLKETAVSSIARASKGEAADSNAKYVISTHAASEKADSAEEYPVEFDSVVIATPWQFAHIDAEGLWEQPIEEIKYRNLHVTLFTSPLRLSREFLGIAPDAKIPTSVLTTRTPEGLDKPFFNSVSTIGGFRNPRTGVDEFAYKVFSLEKVTPEFLSNLLDAEIPEGFTGHSDDAENPEPISWYLPHTFHSYPILDPRVAFQDPVLGEGLYYTSGIESFISTMETSALMGKNVARLVLDDLAAAKQDDEWVVLERPEEGEDKEQKVMGGAEDL